MSGFEEYEDFKWIYEIFYLKRNGCTSGVATLSELFFLPFEKVSTLKGKILFPKGADFFPFRVDPFSEGT